MKVGFGSARITPSLPLTLAGFGARKGLVHEVHDNLEALATVFQDGEKRLCLLVLDLLMMGSRFADTVRIAVAQALSIPFESVMTSCTHTHSGPSGERSSRVIGWPVPEEYLDILVEGAVNAARAAVAMLEPARLTYAEGPLPDGLSINRRGHEYAPRFSVLDILRPDGDRVVTIANVAIHPVAAGITARAVSRDWPGAFRDALSAATGAPCVLLSGAIGDVNPARDPHDEPNAAGNWDSMTQLGQDVATAVLDLLPETREMGDRLTSAHRVERIRAGVTIPALLSRTPLRRATVEFMEWSLGGVLLISLPGEAFHQLGVEVIAARGGQGTPVLLAAIAPQWWGYLPCPWTQGYEEKMSYGRHFVDRVRAALVAAPSIG